MTTGIVTIDEVSLYEVPSDPSVAPGLAAPIGSLALLNGARGLWQKIGVSDTAWLSVIATVVGGSGVTPPFTLSKAGTAGQGTYLRTGEAVGSNTGQPIKGNNNIVEISITNSKAMTVPTTVQLQQRTGINTFADIAGASVTIPVGQYKATAAGLSVAIGPNAEVTAYVKVGVSSGTAVVTDPVLVIYCDPVS